MVGDNFRLREKENAKEWQIKEEPGVHKGNTVNSYFNQYVPEDESSESAGQNSPLDQEKEATEPDHPQLHPQALGRNSHQKKSSRSPPQKATQKQAITFATKRDNAAQVAFRNNVPPAGTVDLGKPIIEIEPHVSTIVRTLEQIGVRVGSYILPERSLNGSKLVIWGNQRQLELSAVELKRWKSIRNTQATAKDRQLAKVAWAKETSLLSQQGAAVERTARRDAKRQHFQKTPQQNQQFKYNGYFLWPNDEIRATELFGPSCEALDPLRIEHKVHITFEEARSVFRVYSNTSVDSIIEVIQRIENTIKEFVARDERPLMLYLIEPLSTIEYRDHVRMAPGPLIGQSQTPSKIPDACGKPLSPIDVVDWEIEAEESASKNRARMCTAIERTLERIPYYRGHLRMRAHFGTFALVKFQWPPGVPSVALREFETDVQSAGTRGTLIRDVQLGRPAQEVIDRLHDAQNLFQTIMTTDERLADVLPQYTAVFHLRHPDRTEETLRLEIDFNANSVDHGFEASRALWVKGLKVDGASQQPPLEIFNIRLHSGISWQLKISATNLVDPSRISPRMEDFASGVRFKKPPPDNYPAISGYKIFTNPTSLPILGLEQKTTFKYSLKAQPRIIVEISRYDEYSGDDARLPSSTQWAVSLWDREWDARLSENARLSLGTSASWNPHVNPFFEPVDPSASREPDAGFKDFLRHTQAIGKFLDGLKMGPPEPAQAADASGTDGRAADGATGKEKAALI